MNESLQFPLHFTKWVKDNKEALCPPVGAQTVFNSQDYLVMAVGGPNARSDYHCQPTEEFFYQIQGDIELKVIIDGTFKSIPLKEGEMFMLPANVPHSPCRYENTVGLVIERKRPKGAIGMCLDRKRYILLVPDRIPFIKDSMQWYCPNLKAHNGKPKIITQASFSCYDLGIQMKPFIEEWKEDEQKRTCGGSDGCGRIAGITEWPEDSLKIE